MTRQQLRDEIVHTFGEPFAYSYFDRSEFRPGTPAMLRPWSFTAERKFKEEAKALLEREGVKLLPADPEHLKPKERRAA